MSAIRRHWHYLAITLLTVVFYFPLVLPGMGLPAGGDFFAFHTPYRVYTSLKLHSGTFPLYAHELFGGYPIFQDPQFALLYPVNLLYGLLVPEVETQSELDFYMLINLVIMSVGALCFMRSFGIGGFASVIAAAITCFNGFMVIHVTHVNMLQVEAMSLFAAGFLVRYARGGAIDIRHVLAAGVALAFGNLAGHPQTTMYTHYAIAAGALVLAMRDFQRSRSRRNALRIIAGAGLAFILGVLLAAVQLVPTAELLRISTRATVSQESVLFSCLDLTQLPSVLFPGFYMRLPWNLEWPPYYHNILPEDPRAWFAWLDDNFSEGYAAMGAAAFLLGLTGWFHNWRSWPVQVLGWGCLFLLGCSLGDDLPFYGWLYDFLPGFKLVRVSTRILLIFFPAWGLLAGLGIQALFTADSARWNRQSALAIGVLVGLMGVWLAWALGNRADNWVDTWITAFTGDGENLFGRTVMRRRGDEFLAALEKQLILAIALLVVLALLLVLPWKHRRLRAFLVSVVVAFELTVYCFGWATAMHYPGITTVESEELRSLHGNIPGRALNFSAPNTALHMGRPVANGYTVTLDDWVTAFQPDIIPPWRLGMQETLLDLWNVSDIVLQRMPREALVGEQTIAVDDWGWVDIGAGWTPDSGETSVTTRALMPTQIAVDLVTTQPIQALHVLGFAGRYEELSDGDEIARAIVYDNRGEVMTSAPIILGKHVSDARYPLQQTAGTNISHSRAPLSYYRIKPNHWSSHVNIFDGQLDVKTTAPIASVTFEATGPYPTTIGVAHVVAVLAGGGFVARDLFGMPGFDEVESRTASQRVLHRDEPPGYARMLPTAIAGSYKRTDNIMWRMFHGGTDLRSSVIVDKRKFDAEELLKLNAPDATAFQGEATIEWMSDRHGRIMTNSNMPGWLFLSQTWDAGWSVEVYGRPEKVYRGNGPFITLPIAAGQHEIHLHYLPTGLVTGTLITATTALLVVATWLYRRFS